MAKRKAATLILLTVIFMMLFSTVSVFAQSSLWSARENKSKIVITKNGDKLDNTKLEDAVDRYKLVNSSNMSVAGSTGFGVTELMYSIDQRVGVFTIEITAFANDLNIFKIKESTFNLQRVFTSFKNQFTQGGSNGFASAGGVVGLAFIFAGCLGLFYLFSGRTSEGFGRILSIVLIFIIAVMFYGNARSVLVATTEFTSAVGGQVERTIVNGNSRYAKIADTFIVVPYNIAQYDGNSDPIAKNQPLNGWAELYNYNLTYSSCKNQDVWFGKKVLDPSTSDENLTYQQQTSDSAHEAVAEKLAGQIDTKIGEWVSDWGADSSGAILTALSRNANPKTLENAGDGNRIGTKKTPAQITYNNGIESVTVTLDKYFANTGSHWWGVAGEITLYTMLLFVMFLLFGLLALLQIAGQLLVLIVVFLGIPIVFYALFKGWTPIRNAVVAIVFGLMVSVIAGALRGLTMKLLDISSVLAGNNMLMSMFFLVAFFIVLWAFRNTIFGIFGMNAPNLGGGIRNAMQAKGFRDMTNALKESVRNESNGQDSEGKVRVARPSSEGGNPMTGTVGENAAGTDENPIVTRPVAERADEKPDEKPDTPMDANELKSKEDEEDKVDKTRVPLVDQYGRPLDIEENAEEADDRATVNSEETAPDVPFETREDANGEERPASQGLSDMSDEELEKQWDRDDLTDETRKEIATEQKSRADEQKRQAKEDEQKAKEEAAIQKQKAKEREKAEFSVMDKKEKAQYVAKKTVNSTGGRATLKAMKGTGKAAETVLKGTGKAAKHTGSAILKSQKKSDAMIGKYMKK